MIIVFNKHDPIEDTEEYKAIEDELEEEILANIGEGGYSGYQELYWSTKKEILKEDYGINWKSPMELNKAE